MNSYVWAITIYDELIYIKTADDKVKIWLLLYQVILKHIWTCGIQVWGTDSNSNIEILQRFQSKVLRKIVNALWFVSNKTIYQDLKMFSVQEEIYRFSSQYLDKLNEHANHLAVRLLENSEAIDLNVAQCWIFHLDLHTSGLIRCFCYWAVISPCHISSYTRYLLNVNIL